MGGIGSGNWHRWNTQTTVEETKRIDIRYMRNRGFLKPNTHGTLSWSRGGEPNGNINFVTHDDYLQLNFRYKEYGGEWQPMQQKIFFDYTPCHYGNTRQWLVCPKCGKRVAVLCSDSPLFLCRHCHQLPYGSQMEGVIERLRRQRDKIGKRLYEDYQDGFGSIKKKGIHWATFNRLEKEYFYLSEHFENRIFDLAKLLQ